MMLDGVRAVQAMLRECIMCKVCVQRGQKPKAKKYIFIRVGCQLFAAIGGNVKFRQ